MLLTLDKKQIANNNNDIDTYGKSRDYIEDKIKPFLKKENIGKYIIFRDDSGEAQTDTYKGRKIINESAEKANPFITLSSQEDEIYVLPFSSRGGKRSKKKYRIRRTRRNRYKSRRQIKK
jgi:hypothetical protein